MISRAFAGLFLIFFSALGSSSCEPEAESPASVRSVESPASVRSVESPASVLSGDGIPIFYEVHGSGGPALVFVHGWSCDRSYWDGQVSHFSGNHLVVTVDLAGHGDSGAGREIWSMSAFGQDVAAVVKALGLEEVVLVGHSMGGPVVVEAARILEDRVKGVVGADTFNDLSLSYSDEEVEAFARPLREDFGGTMRRIVGGMFLPTSDSTLASWVIEDMGSAPPAIAVGAVEEMVGWYEDGAEGTLGTLRAPLRLINSDYQPTNVEAGRELVPSLEVVLMSGVGHFVMMEDPETFNRLLEEIVEGFSALFPQRP